MKLDVLLDFYMLIVEMKLAFFLQQSLTDHVNHNVNLKINLLVSF